MIDGTFSPHRTIWRGLSDQQASRHVFTTFSRLPRGSCLISYLQHFHEEIAQYLHGHSESIHMTDSWVLGGLVQLRWMGMGVAGIIVNGYYGSTTNIINNGMNYCYSYCYYNGLFGMNSLMNSLEFLIASEVFASDWGCGNKEGLSVSLKALSRLTWESLEDGSQKYPRVGWVRIGPFIRSDHFSPESDIFIFKHNDGCLFFSRFWDNMG